MGSLQLDCPLCCSETFTCFNSLKYHLLSISDNLICPACGQRFERIFELAMHLGRECEDGVEQGAIHCSIKLEDSQLSDANEDSNITSILAKALLKNSDDKPELLNCTETTNLEYEEVEMKVVSSDDEAYYCSSCAISFTCIDDHLEKYHEGHEVFLQETKEETENSQSPDNSILVLDDIEVDEDCENKDVTEITKPIKFAELLNTIEENECVDKDGRLYTRKVVKIEKFWNDKEIKEDPEFEETSCITLNEQDSEETIVLENSHMISTDDDVFSLYQCSKCRKKFSTMDLYSKHKCMLSKDKYKKCKICEAAFINSKFLSAHMKTHKNNISVVPSDPNPPFICEVCKTEFSTYKSLRLHRRMHEPIKSKDIEPPVNYGMLGEQISMETAPQEMFICQLCNKAYNKEYEEAHKNFHSVELDFNCEICNRKFFTQENLDMHMHAHTETKKFVCSYCKKGFLTTEKLEAHMSSKCQKRQYACQYCGRRFARPHEKVKHERIHTGEKPHVCEICGKAFRVSYCLTLHMRTHSGTRPYKCERCGKRFKAHSVYNHHLLTHSEDRKYKCPYCPKTFKTGVQLAGHKNSHIKPFTCTECNRPFASLYAVRAHMETHQRHNNLKYRCWLCGASYARAFALRDHIREQHVNEQDNNPDPDNIILEADDYPIAENIGPNETILEEPDENILIDISTQAVCDVEISEVQEI